MYLLPIFAGVLTWEQLGPTFGSDSPYSAALIRLGLGSGSFILAEKTFLGAVQLSSPETTCYGYFAMLDKKVGDGAEVILRVLSEILAVFTRRWSSTGDIEASLPPPYMVCVSSSHIIRLLTVPCLANTTHSCDTLQPQPQLQPEGTELRVR